MCLSGTAPPGAAACGLKFGFADNILFSLAKKCEKIVKSSCGNVEAAELLRPGGGLAGRMCQKEKMKKDTG